MCWKCWARIRWAVRRRLATREQRRAWYLQERYTMQPEPTDEWTVTKSDHRSALIWAWIFNFIDH